VEISSGQDIAVLENQWVVGNRVELGFDHARSKIQCITAGAMNLRHTAQTIWILYLAAMSMRVEDFTSGQQASDVSRHLDLAPVWPDLLDTLIEGNRTALQGFQAHRCDDVGRLAQCKAAFQHEGAVGRHELCSVDQRETVLGFELYGSQPALMQSAECVALGPVFPVPDGAASDQWQAQVRQWRQVARRAYTATAGDPRQQVVELECQQLFEGAAGNA
jgi:hypothetical protein